MKLYSEIADVSVDKGNKNFPSNTNEQRSTSAILYDSVFYKCQNVESVRLDTFNNLKAGMKVSMSFSKQNIVKQSVQQPYSLEDINKDVTFATKCKETEYITKVDKGSNLDYKSKPCIISVKPCLYRGNSDVYLNQNSWKGMEYHMDINCRTEYAIPGEFLFCSEVEHSNNFALVYDQIRSRSNLRRSQSTGSISSQSKSNKEKDDFHSEVGRYFQKGEAMIVATRQSKTENPHNKDIDSNCENINNKCDEYDRRELSKRDSKFLANELQSILNNNGKSLDLKKGNSFTSRNRQKKETSFTQDIYVENDKNIGEVTLQNHSEQVTANMRPPVRCGSQSCKAVQGHASNLFSISQYLKDRHTQRSKSFATIREFSTHDVNYRQSSTRTVGGKECARYYNYAFPDASDEYYDSDSDLNKIRSFSKSVGLTPIKTITKFDINHTDARGNSCLHHASSKGDISTIKYLLEQGGDVWLKNDEQHLPIDLAQNFKTAKLLSSATLFYSEQNESKKEKNILQTSKLNIAL